MQLKIKKMVINMGLRPHLFASNKESFVFQIHNMLYLLDKIDFEKRSKLFNVAGILKGNTYINCSDEFDNEWGKTVSDYALSLIE